MHPEYYQNKKVSLSMALPSCHTTDGPPEDRGLEALPLIKSSSELMER